MHDGELRLWTAAEVEGREQELVDQYAVAMSASGLSDGCIRGTRAIVVVFARWTTRPLWEATSEDADRFPAERRRLGHDVSSNPNPNQKES